MRLRCAPVSLGLMLVFALAAAGCGGDTPAEQAQKAAAQQQQHQVSTAAQAENAQKEARKQLDKALKEAKTNAKKGTSTPERMDPARQVRAFNKVRKACLARVRKVEYRSTRDAIANARAICNQNFTDAVSSAKRQAKLVKDAYPRCLEQAKAEKDAKAREKILIGCASIPR